jgi:hypothetical protein
MRGAVAAGESLTRLHELIEEEGGELAAALVPLATVRRGDGGRVREAFGPLVAAAERSRPNPGEYGLLVESICEGYLLHYWRGRLVRPADEDLSLLAGDFLYALGLSRLARLGDLTATAELADLIALSAHVHSVVEHGEDAAEPAAGVWSVCALGVGAGPWPEGEEAKALVREDPSAAALEVLDAAARRARELGLSLEAEQALIAFREIASRDLGST